MIKKRLNIVGIKSAFQFMKQHQIIPTNVNVCPFFSLLNLPWFVYF